MGGALAWLRPQPWMGVAATVVLTAVLVVAWQAQAPVVPPAAESDAAPAIDSGPPAPGPLQARGLDRPQRLRSDRPEETAAELRHRLEQAGVRVTTKKAAGEIVLEADVPAGSEKEAARALAAHGLSLPEKAYFRIRVTPFEPDKQRGAASK
jgi:preprotein translocase subunit SecD